MLQLQAVCDFILLLQPFMASSKPLATRLHMLIADGVEKKAINWYCNLFCLCGFNFDMLRRPSLKCVAPAQRLRPRTSLPSKVSLPVPGTYSLAWFDLNMFQTHLHV